MRKRRKYLVPITIIVVSFLILFVALSRVRNVVTKKTSKKYPPVIKIKSETAYKEGKILKTTPYPTLDQVEIPFPFEGSILVDYEGNFWVSDSISVALYDFKNWCTNITVETPNLKATSGGVLLWGKGRLFIYRDSTLSLNSTPDLNCEYLDVLVDERRKIWLLVEDNYIYSGSEGSWKKVQTPGRAKAIAPFDGKRILVATEDGLFLSDGRSFSNRHIPETLAESKIDLLYTTRNKDVYGIFKNATSGLKGSFLLSDGEFQINYISENILNLFEDSLGNIWGYYKDSTSGETGFCSFDGSDWNKIEIYQMKRMSVKPRNISMDRKGRIYWVTLEKVYRIDIESNAIEEILPPGLLSDKITVIRYFGEKWYIGTTKGLSIFDGLGWRSYPGERVIDIAGKTGGNIFVLTSERLIIFDSNFDREFAYLPSGCEVSYKNTEIAVDNNGDAWIVSDAMIAQCSAGLWNTYCREDGLTGDLKSVVFDGKNVWVGGPRRLFRRDGGSWEEIIFPSTIPDNQVFNMAPINQGELVIGTDIGLLHYKNGYFKEILSNTRAQILRVEKGFSNDVWYQIANFPIGNLHLQTEKFSTFDNDRLYFDIDAFCIRSGCFDIDNKGNLLTGGICGLKRYTFSYPKIYTEKIEKRDKAEEELSYRKEETFDGGARTRVFITHADDYNGVDEYTPTDKKQSTYYHKKIQEAAAGEIIWSTSIKKTIYAEVFPVIYENYLLIPQYDGALSCCDLEKGEVIWRKRFMLEKPKIRPAVSGGKVFTSNGDVKIHNLLNGEFIKTLPFKALDIFVRENEVYFLTKDSILIFDSYSMRVENCISIERRGRTCQWIHADGEKIWVLGRSGLVCCSKDGKTIWENKRFYSFPSNSRKAPPLFSRDFIYYTSWNNILKIDPESGNIVEKVDIKTPIYISPVITEEYFVFKSSDNLLLCLNKDLSTEWKLNDIGISSPVIRSEDVLYTSTNHEGISAYNLRNGVTLWHCDLGHRVGSSYIGEYNDLIIAVSSGSRIFAIKK